MSQHPKQRNTQQRRIVLEELRKVTSHPTAAELCELVRLRLPKISLGTVYRNLDVLSQAGEVAKIEWGGSETRFDGDSRQHYHVRCLGCGSVADVHLPPVDISSEDLERDGYEVLGHRLEFIAVCPKCRSEMSGEEAEKNTDQLCNNHT